MQHAAWKKTQGEPRTDRKYINLWTHTPNSRTRTTWSFTFHSKNLAFGPHGCEPLKVCVGLNFGIKFQFFYSFFTFFRNWGIENPQNGVTVSSHQLVVVSDRCAKQVARARYRLLQGGFLRMSYLGLKAVIFGPKTWFKVVFGSKHVILGQFWSKKVNFDHFQKFFVILGRFREFFSKPPFITVNCAPNFTPNSYSYKKILTRFGSKQ